MPTQELAASFGRLAANHLWQSTGFAAVAVLLALALRANTARARYWLWLTASVKFLIPFSVLAAIGGSLGRWLVPTVPVSRFPSVMEEIVKPFTPLQDALLPAASVPLPATPALLPPVLLALWLCGFAAVLLYWWVRWRRVAAAVRASLPLTQGREVESLHRLQWGGPPGLPSSTVSLVSSTASLEPGIFGIFRPVLWLPAGIANRLEDAELEAILAHELCHARRRDNLTAAIHMAVEAIFWFHPLVWWWGALLSKERERACDEEVVRMGGEPQIYAESILKVCEFYLASPVACAAGVTGGELKKRIEGIMTNRFTRKLSNARVRSGFHQASPTARWPRNDHGLPCRPGSDHLHQYEFGQSGVDCVRYSALPAFGPQRNRHGQVRYRGQGARRGDQGSGQAHVAKPARGAVQIGGTSRKERSRSEA